MNVRRDGFTMIELLVVILIIGLLLALLLPAIQTFRESGRRTACISNLRQISLALQQHQASKGVFPAGVSSRPAWQTWCVRLLPYLERNDIWESSRQDYQRQPDPFRPVPHPMLGQALAIFACPTDDHVKTPQTTQKGYAVGLTSYVGVAGTNFELKDGALFRDSRIQTSDIRDGIANTIIVAERPPSSDFWFGWWYAGVGQQGSGVPDMLLGARERSIGYGQLARCPPGPYQFAPGTGDLCDVLHYWSLHPGGANFAFADASVRFLSYDGEDIVARLATRAKKD
jgi:prepilin-type N-terminal cleavage/methylation domain-containing protein/prepilin-type processing-associated H-X9-DG protein